MAIGSSLNMDLQYQLMKLSMCIVTIRRRSYISKDSLDCRLLNDGFIRVYAFICAMS